MRRMLLGYAVALIAVCAFARPGPRPGRGFAHPHHRHHHGSVAWGVGAGVLGAGLIANAIYNSTRPQTVVVSQPTVVTPVPTVVAPAPTVVTQPAVVVQPSGHYEDRVQNVWVEGRYIDQISANGTVVRTWQPGHYEQQTTRVWVQH